MIFQTIGIVKYVWAVLGSTEYRHICGSLRQFIGGEIIHFFMG